MIWVTPRSQLLATIKASGARHVVTLQSPAKPPAGVRVGSDAATVPDLACPDVPNHLQLTMNDIHEPRPGLVLPRRSHVEDLLAFDRARPDGVPLVISCYAGISRSTAAAYILGCQRATDRDETELALLLRQRAPSATPNPRLIALADELLARRRRMISAIERIGRGAEAFAGVPFSLPESGL